MNCGNIQRNGEKCVKKLNVFKGIIIIMLLLVAWFVLYAQRYPTVELDQEEPGIISLQDIDLTTTIAKLSDNWELYPEKLYTHTDFISEEVEGVTTYEELEGEVAYGTYRVIIEAEPFQYYSVCGYSIDYGMKVFVDGSEVVEVGRVADNGSEAVGRVNYVTFPIYIGESGMAEIIVQYSNFVHNEGGALTALYISTPTLIEQYKIQERLAVFLLCGGLVMLAVYHLLDGFLRGSRTSIQLACCCFLFAFRDQAFYIAQLIPWDYNWNIHYRIVVLVICLSPMAMLLLIESLYPKLVHKWFTWAYVIITSGCVIALMTVETYQVVLVSYSVIIPSVLYLFWLTYCIIRHFMKVKKVNQKDIITLVAILVLVIAMVVESFYNRSLPEVTRGGITPAGILIFVLLFMIIISIQSGEDRVALVKSMEQEAWLTRMSEMKSEFLRKVAHELRTPLTIMSGYAQLSSWQLQEQLTPDQKLEMIESMGVITSESDRLAKMVTNLMDISYGNEVRTARENIPMIKILQETQAVCKPILEKNQNTIVCQCNPEIHAYVNGEMVLQVLINLCVNSNKHMQGGVVTIEVQESVEDKEYLRVLVQDTGDGIEESRIEQVFDKGYTTDGGNGLGLYICKEIITLHKGVIQVINSNDQGTTIEFTIGQK